jgi:hypothetical protein
VEWEEQQQAAVGQDSIEQDAKGPLISVVAASAPTLSEQSYPHWEIVSTADAAKGDFILVLGAGDRLARHALHNYAQAHSADESAAVLYSDEDCIDAQGIRTDPCFKPGWSPELLRSTLYLGRSVMYRRELFLATKGMPASQDLENQRMLHIPRVLYHRSGGAGVQTVARSSEKAPGGSKIAVIVCSRKPRQVMECLEAVRATCGVELEILVVQHRESTGDGDEMRGVVERHGGTCIPYLGSFDFARMNNVAASKATAPYLLFMNDDVIVRKVGWDHAIAATLSRPEMGIVGTMLQYPDGTIQHAGVVVGMGDAAGHCGRFQTTSELWPWLRMSRDVSAVTGAMLGIRSEVFRKMSGFDEDFPINYNDVDLCLRARQAGLRVVCLNVGEVIHRESQTRVAGTRYHEREALYQRWGSVLSRPDEFYSRHLAPIERIALNMQETGHPLEGLASAPSRE